MYSAALCLFFFFFNDTATTEIYTLSLHDALPISLKAGGMSPELTAELHNGMLLEGVQLFQDRKSTRLNSSHSQISYAVFCLKKKKNINRVRAMRVSGQQHIASPSGVLCACPQSND